MNTRNAGTALALAIALTAATVPWPAVAQEASPATGTAASRWYFQTSYYTRHWHDNADHNNNQRLIDIEHHNADNVILGGSFFYNSFDQPTEYVYFGKLWRPFSAAPLVHVKLTGGLIHGYKQDYRDKIPYNEHGIAPAILPAIGISGKTFATEAIFFGVAGVMLTAGFYWN